MNEDPSHLSNIFAMRMTSEFNQHITGLMVGRTGAGKSSFIIRLGYDTAIRVAEKMGGEWEDYFNIDNIGIITREEIYRVMNISKKYSFLMLDDIGVGWNARKWQDDFNNILNDILQTFRTDNTALTLTLPDSFLIDKVPRSLVHYFMEMDLSIFEKGVTTAKVLEVVRKPRSGKIFHQYPQYHGKKYVRYVAKQAPAELMEAYEEKRNQIARDLKAERLEDFRIKMEKLIAQDDVDPSPKITKKDRVLELARDVEAGVYTSFKEAVSTHNSEFPKWKISMGYAANVRAGMA